MSKEILQDSEPIIGWRVTIYYLLGKSPHIVRMHTEPSEQASQQWHHFRLVDVYSSDYIVTIQSCTDEPINAGLASWLKIPLRLQH